MVPATTAKRDVSLDTIDLPSLCARAKEWAYLNGLVMRSAHANAVVHAPIAVLPCPFPRENFEKAVDVMPLMNRLYDRVSCDADFLTTTLQSAAEFDDFTANLLKIYAEVKEFQNGRGDIALGIHRSDYMLDQPSNRLLQVEQNTIASSFGALSSQVSKMHAHLLSQSKMTQLDNQQLVDNRALIEIAYALAEAHKTMEIPDSAILMVVTPDDSNIYDQQHSISVIRKSHSEIMDCSILDDSGNLVIDGMAISVAYYRSGYSPKSYPTTKEWEARRRIEMSSACKCPSISYHLTGTKKIQQELAKPGRLERYLTASECQRVREFFAGLWGLDDQSDPEVQSIIQEAIENPEKFVLKPQREGGGNNLYGSEAAAVLSKGQGLAAYVLMQRIQPTLHRSLLLRNEEHLVEKTVSELGIYGTFLRKENTVIINRSAGHLLRTKVATSDEGGVAAGFAVLDSPYLE